jgi:hypothetical protein
MFVRLPVALEATVPLIEIVIWLVPPGGKFAPVKEILFPLLVFEPQRSAGVQLTVNPLITVGILSITLNLGARSGPKLVTRIV